MAKKKVMDGLENSPGIKMKTEKKQPKPKQAKVSQLHPKAKNKDSVTENIQSKSSKSIKDNMPGKTSRVPLSPNLKSTKKK